MSRDYSNALGKVWQLDYDITPIYVYMGLGYHLRGDIPAGNCGMHYCIEFHSPRLVSFCERSVRISQPFGTFPIPDFGHIHLIYERMHFEFQCLSSPMTRVSFPV